MRAPDETTMGDYGWCSMSIAPSKAAAVSVAERTNAGSRLRARAVSLAGLVLAAIVIGVGLGAMACAVSLASGGHGVTHVEVEAEPLTAASWRTDHSATVVDVAFGVSPESEAASGDDRLPTTLAQNHPGMACVVLVDLRIPDRLVLMASTALPGGPIPAPIDCAADLDPPIPRIS
jgi:hypothetical protein